MDSKSQNLILIALLSLIIGATFISIATRHFWTPEHSKAQQNNLVQRAKDTKQGAALAGALQKLTDEGNPVAARELAELYHYGKEVPRDFHKARALVELAAKAKDPEGLRLLAAYYSLGLAGPSDENKAIDTNAEAASLGSKKAKRIRATTYMQGWAKVKQDY